MQHEVYLDSAATTQVFPEVAAQVHEVLTRAYGNPSSLHRKGLEAERLVRQAREVIARALGAQPGEVVFTSGGTEGNNLAIKGAARARARRGKHLITTQIEHESVLAAFRDLEEEGFRVTWVPPGPDGLIDPESIAGAVTDETILISVMAVNNEVGSVQPLAEIVRAVRRRAPEVLVHADAVQAFLKVPLQPQRMGIDLLTISGHKFHAPKGVGALYVRRGVHIKPLLGGGGQEGGLRSGTENVAGIVGMGVAAARLAAEGEAYRSHLAALRAQFLEGLAATVPDVCVNSPAPPQGAGHIVNISFPGVRGEVLLHELAAHGVYVSTGSACSSRRRGESHVLAAMGVSRDRLESSIRVSFSALTTAEEIRRAVQAFGAAVQRLRAAVGARR